MRVTSSAQFELAILIKVSDGRIEMARGFIGGDAYAMAYDELPAGPAEHTWKDGSGTHVFHGEGDLTGYHTLHVSCTQTMTIEGAWLRSHGDEGAVREDPSGDPGSPN